LIYGNEKKHHSRHVKKCIVHVEPFATVIQNMQSFLKSIARKSAKYQNPNQTLCKCAHRVLFFDVMKESRDHIDRWSRSIES